MNSRRWNSVTKIVVSAALAILAIGLLFIFRVMIAPTIVAFLLAFILSYPVNWIQGRTGWARGPIVGLIYAVAILLIAGTPALFLSRLLALGESLQLTLNQLVADLQNPNAEFINIGNLVIPIGGLLEDVGGFLGNLLSALPTNPFSVVREVTSRILTIIYVLVLNFWLLKDIYKLQRFVMEQISSEYQEDVRRLSVQLGAIWSGFLRGQVVLGTVVGILTWVALSIVGMPNAGGLALLAGVMEFLPTVGPGFSGTIGVAVAFFSQSTWLGIEGVTFALVVLAIYAVIAQYETIVLIPRLVGGRVQLHPAVTFVGIISGALVFGLLGVLLATPILGSARVLLSYIYRKLLDLEPFDPAPAAQSNVRIRGLIAGRKIEGIVFDLDGTLTELDMQLVDTVAERLTWMDRLISPQLRQRIMWRIMVTLEGPINFIISQLLRLQLLSDLDRVMPTLNRLRGYPSKDALVAFPDTPSLLQELTPQYQLALVSTRSRATIDSFLAKYGMVNGLFKSIVAREDVRNLMPHGEGLMLAAEQLQLPADSLLVVSDTEVNLRSGRAVEMATAGVLTGLGRAKDLGEADLVLDSPTELCEWL